MPKKKVKAPSASAKKAVRKKVVRKKVVKKAAKRQTKWLAEIEGQPLSDKEAEVVRLVSLGCTVKEAAAILKVAPSTVDNHRTRAMAKLGVDKAALLTRVAIREGVTTLDEKLTTLEKRRSGRKGDGWN